MQQDRHSPGADRGTTHQHGAASNNGTVCAAGTGSSVDADRTDAAA